MAALTAPTMGEGRADVVRDTMLKCVVTSLKVKELSEKDDEWFDEIFAMMKKGRSGASLIRRCAGDPEEVRVLELVFGEGPGSKSMDNRIKCLRAWMRNLIPRKNYCWVSSYPSNYLSIILRLIDPEFADRFPPSGKEVLVMMVDSWFNKHHSKKLEEIEEARRLKKEKDTADAKEEEEARQAKKRSRAAAAAAAAPATASPGGDKKRRKSKKKEPEPEPKAGTEAEVLVVDTVPAPAPLLFVEDSSNSCPPEGPQEQPSLPVVSNSALMNEPAAVVPDHLPLQDTPSESAGAASEKAPPVPAPAEPQENLGDLLKLIRNIRSSLLHGDSQIKTVPEMAATVSAPPAAVARAAKKMHEAEEVFFEEGAGVIMLI